MSSFLSCVEEEKFLRKKFSEYYSNPLNPLLVARPESREFGFGGWEKKIEFRHIAVKSHSELRFRLISDAPLYVSHSVAYYEFPQARPMVRKNWLFADLVFDLDAEAHACGKFTCNECLMKVKSDALKLIEDFLLPDFGFSLDQLSINFSGSRGYHVHVHSDSVLHLDRDARREIADYITGTGLAFDRLFWEDGKKLLGPNPQMGGYGGKFAQAFILRLDDEKFSSSLSRKLLNREVKEKLKIGISQGNWDKIGMAKRKERLYEKFEEMRLTMSGRIDANVTADTSKLIRLPGSIHGGSGFLAKTIKTVLDLSNFDPMNMAPAFISNETIKIKASEDIPGLCIADYSFGPIPKGQTADLPLASAVYLLCKKSASLVA